MANRPSKNSTKKQKKTQSDINKIKPVGVLTLDLMETKSTQVSTINVQLPDNEIYEFYYLPMTADEADEFHERNKGGERIQSIRDMCAQRLVNKDGSPMVPDSAALGNVDIRILNALVAAMFGSDQEEGGED